MQKLNTVKFPVSADAAKVKVTATTCPGCNVDGASHDNDKTDAATAGLQLDVDTDNASIEFPVFLT
jgi:hypothetical protein